VEHIAIWSLSHFKQAVSIIHWVNSNLSI